MPIDELCRELIVRCRPDRNANGRAFEHAHEMARARIAGVGKKDALVAVDDQRHDEQQRRGRAVYHAE